MQKTSIKGKIDLDSMLWFNGGYYRMELNMDAKKDNKLSLSSRILETDTSHFDLTELDPELMIEGYTENYLLGTVGDKLIIYTFGDDRKLAAKSKIFELPVQHLLGSSIFEGKGKQMMACFLAEI